MNVRVELDNNCPACWVPEKKQMESWLSKAGAGLKNRHAAVALCVRVVDERDSASLNATYRGLDKPTNVLSCGCDLPGDVALALDSRPIGDLAICAPVLETEARQQGKTLEAHWAHLLTHGFLHLNGYDHETDADAEKMEALEIRVLEAMGFPNPYLPVAEHADN